MLMSINSLWFPLSVFFFLNQNYVVWNSTISTTGNFFCVCIYTDFVVLFGFISNLHNWLALDSGSS